MNVSVTMVHRRLHKHNYRGYTAVYHQPEPLVSCKNTMARLQFDKYIKEHTGV